MVAILVRYIFPKRVARRVIQESWELGGLKSPRIIEMNTQIVKDKKMELDMLN